ncbi:unnamed protein product [Eruca vesicaria subsp. sativa]|uniref:Uncharacterized protein n=1 Tax=Eruca vesicaria subsp. sativa TaxID=29727 RepID=A0ABC8IWA0_ERUVS|nr:unnamed protein product [Eruca vesicaria subsp. sativa]
MLAITGGQELRSTSETRFNRAQVVLRESGGQIGKSRKGATEQDEGDTFGMSGAAKHGTFEIGCNSPKSTSLRGGSQNNHKRGSSWKRHSSRAPRYQAQRTVKEGEESQLKGKAGEEVETLKKKNR